MLPYDYWSQCPNNRFSKKDFREEEPAAEKERKREEERESEREYRREKNDE